MSGLWNIQTFVGNFFEPVRKIPSAFSPKGNKRGIIPPNLQKREMELKQSLNCFSMGENEGEKSRLESFLQVLREPVVDIQLLRSMSWYGIPEELRSLVWPLLLGYMPADKRYHMAVLEDKRSDYYLKVAKYFQIQKMNDDDVEIINQIKLDIPRTIPKGINLDSFKDERIQKIIERTLFIWSKENRMTTYFQGLTDVFGQMLIVLLSFYDKNIFVGPYHEESLNNKALFEVEADAFWCFSIFVDGMKPFFTQNLHIGISQAMTQLKYILNMVDEELEKHFDKENLDMMHFALRWMLCLLTREFHVSFVSRIWDSYLSEGEHFMGDFHIYLCAAFIHNYKHRLLKMDFSEMLTFLQHLPTDSWTDKDVEDLIWRSSILKETEKSIRDLMTTGAILNLVSLMAATQLIDQSSHKSEEQK